MIERVVIAGGGTGGHLFPGIAVVEELRRRNHDLDVAYVGTERGIEARVIPAMRERFEALDVRPLKGTDPAGFMKSLLKLPGAWSHAVSILRDVEPDVVLGVGGYSSGPMLVAAASLGIPCALMEQNAHVGLTNRMLAPVVGRAYLTYEVTASHFGEKARVVGNPVRRAFVDAARLALSDPEAFELRARRILVLGGSQGAKALNETVPEALAAAGVTERGIEVVHQTGAAMQAEVVARYEALGVKAEVVSFIDDMARAYASSTLVIARAGATTLAELCAIGRPSILVPYPHAADDHQARNAEALERAGAAIAIRQASLTIDRLAGEVRALLDDPARRRAMAAAARDEGRPDAAAAIVDDLISWLGRATMTPARVPTIPPPRHDPEPGMAFARVDFRASRGSIEARRASAPPVARFEPAVFPIPRAALAS
ncbi:undecaprenyldiphospho-muramoylpentapeptide beta-N-acetylglucosaminyltransferase [Sandaracinus amylolyticus]|uniref:undecaprenyldiphospho-muramoylpentapeptide beta-N-acetylglucosaminyltransferase n=1 Tax=Sandaracinus amylolyticus TaxID=927083 RepID=UPI001F018D7E|nr:undecaprenyldiphospho-muramoylpentapeptide beta-N-acetylglucosaminyltransferase [Sandaracinus amylolyticus]UJR80107.1 Undecaprenyldiphospho-muramoylpentapeptide beta-N-acetylglucosaminyltransferase [Sandaracinus amylolyticus]